MTQGPSTEPDSGEQRARKLAAELIAREAWSREQLLAFQGERLRGVVAHALKNSAYYQQAVKAIGRSRLKLQDLPILTKPILMAEFDRIVTDPRLKLADIEKHLASELAPMPMPGRYRVLPTGGTTGQRSVAVYDRSAQIRASARTVVWMRRLVVAPQTRIVGIGAPTPIHVSNQMFSGLRKGRDAPELAVTMPLGEVVEALNAYQPEVLITYPSYLRELAEEQRTGRLAISPTRFGSVAEALPQDLRRLARELWNAPVLDSYATTETGMIAMDCERTDGLHIAEDELLLEVVDEDYRPVPRGTAGERVLVTAFYNPVLPLIRYEISDRVQLAETPCPCGRPHWRIAAIAGRREDMLELPAKAGGRIKVPAVRFRDPLVLQPALRQFQLSSGADRLEVKVVLRPDIGEAEEVLRAIRAAIATELDRAGAVVEALSVERVERIERVGTGVKERLVARP